MTQPKFDISTFGVLEGVELGKLSLQLKTHGRTDGDRQEDHGRTDGQRDRKTERQKDRDTDRLRMD